MFRKLLSVGGLAWLFLASEASLEKPAPLRARVSGRGRYP